MGDETRYSDLSDWETETHNGFEDVLEAQEQRLQREKERNTELAYSVFQGAAENVSQLYKESNAARQWANFRSAALSATDLYKESKDAWKRGVEAGLRVGALRRNKEILHWMRKQRGRHVRREELIGFLCSRTPPPRVKPPAPHKRREAVSSMGDHARAADPSGNSLQMFHDAVHMQELQRSMQYVSVGRQRGSGGNTSPPHSATAHPSPERRKRSPSSRDNTDLDFFLNPPSTKRYKHT